MQNDENNKKIWAQIIAKASSNEKFKQELIKYPLKILKDYGVEIPNDHQINIHENTENTTNLIIKNKKFQEMT